MKLSLKSKILLVCQFYLFAYSFHAEALCSSPTAGAGAIEWHTPTSRYILCDGTSWKGINLDPVAVGSGCSPKSREYDSGLKSIKVCNTSGQYQKMICKGGGLASTCTDQVHPRFVFTKSDGAASDFMGRAVALSADGSTAVVGAYADDVLSNTNQGSVSVFVKTGSVWSLQQVLTKSNGHANEEFGYSVALSADGNTLIVGAHQSTVTGNINEGSATIFTRTGGVWTEQQILTKSDGASGDYFGKSVAMAGDGQTVAVGASEDTIGGNAFQGSATVFIKSGATWTEQTILTQPGGAADHYFGLSLSLAYDGNTLLVGAPGDTDSGTSVNKGAAIVFVRNSSTWAFQATLRRMGGVAGDVFGSSVSLSASGNTALIGAYNYDVLPDYNIGAALIFNRSGTVWSEEALLTKKAWGGEDRLGQFVSLSADGKRALVGVPLDGVGVIQNMGSAALFEKVGSTWQEKQILTKSDGQNDDNFGVGVALSGNGQFALVGAEWDDIGANSAQGSASLFELTSSAEVFNYQKTDAVDGDYFGGARISGDGQTVVAAHSYDTVGANFLQGSVVILARSGGYWAFQQLLTKTGGLAEEEFGHSIAISDDGNTVAVGTRFDSAAGGGHQSSVTVFVRSGATWTQQQVLTKSDGVSGDYFGSSVDLSGDGNTLIVASNNDTVGANASQGSAVIFVRSGATWTQQQVLTKSDGAANDQFGGMVRLSSDGQYALVGASLDDVSFVDQGSVTVFLRSGSVWTQQQILTKSDGGAGDRFGSAIDMASDGSSVIIGASRDTIGANAGQGSATIFTRTGTSWAQQQILTKSDGAATDYFGSVAMTADGNRVAIGASWDDVNGLVNRGSVTFFYRSGTSWTQEQILTKNDGAAGDEFGSTVSLADDGETLAVSSPADDFPGVMEQGSVSVFKIGGISTNCVAANSAGTAFGKPPTSPWTALSSLSLIAGQSLFICLSSGDTVSSVTWKGLGLTKIAEAGSNGNAHAFIYGLLDNATFGRGDVIVNFGASPTNGGALAASIVENLTTTSLDTARSATGSSGLATVTLASSTTQKDEFLFSCLSVNGPTETSITWGNEFLANQSTGTTGAGAASNWSVYEALRDVSALGTYTSNLTGSAGRPWAIVLAAFKKKYPACSSYGVCQKEGAMDFSGFSFRWCDGTYWRELAL